jgi:hypothetical protein
MCGWHSNQLSFWMNDDACTSFPTLYFDVFVDTFFLVHMKQGIVKGLCREVAEDGGFAWKLMVQKPPAMFNATQAAPHDVPNKKNAKGF